MYVSVCLSAHGYVLLRGGCAAGVDRKAAKGWGLRGEEWWGEDRGGAGGGEKVLRM